MLRNKFVSLLMFINLTLGIWSILVAPRLIVRLTMDGAYQVEIWVENSLASLLHSMLYALLFMLELNRTPLRFVVPLDHLSPNKMLVLVLMLIRFSEYGHTLRRFVKIFENSMMRAMKGNVGPASQQVMLFYILQVVTIVEMTCMLHSCLMRRFNNEHPIEVPRLREGHD